MAPVGGSHHQDRRLMHDTTTSSRRSDQQPASQDTTSGNAHSTGGRGSEQSPTEGGAIEDDDEEEEAESPTAYNGEQLDDDTDADVSAPFCGYGKGGKGKGKRPAIRVEPGEDAKTHREDDEIPFHGAGLIPHKHPLNSLLKTNKKRTFSNLSSTSVLFGDDSTDQESFPRRKVARKLSNAVTKPLLTYKESEEEPFVTRYENAIESDDEDYSGVNLVPEDDESDVETMERREESYILQEEQQATALLNEYRDARRLSLDSVGSDNIFGVSAPLDDVFISGLPEFGFAQFFEPEAIPASPEPAAKRKFSDSSTKRVRFDDEVQISDDSSSESSELDSSVFPDLFLDQDKLPPLLHQLMEVDPEDDGDIGSPMSDASFWDFGQEESRITQVENSDDSDDNSSVGSSGYDCMRASHPVIFFPTNTNSQLIWVTRPTKRISIQISDHEHRQILSLSCGNQHQHPGPEQLLQNHSNVVLDPLVVRSLQLAVFLSTMPAMKPSRSQIVPPRQSHSTDPALR